jgi:hypothetical protein
LVFPGFLVELGVQTTPRVQFLLPIAAGRAIAGKGVVFSYEEIKSGSVKRVGPAMVLCPGMGLLHLGFEVPGDGSLAADPDFLAFARKLIRSIPSPFYSLSLGSDSLKLLFLCTLENLQIEWRAGDTHARICAEEGEYLSLFADEALRLRTILSANGGMDHYDTGMREIRTYFCSF